MGRGASAAGIAARKGVRMMDFTMIETAWGDQEAMIHISRDSEEFKAAAQVLGDFMNSLNLPADKHNRLVELIVAQVGAAEESAFKQGVGLGLEYGRYESSYQPPQDSNHEG